MSPNATRYNRDRCCHIVRSRTSSRAFAIDLPPPRFLDAAADLALHLRRGHRKPLVGAPDAHTETAAGAVAEVRENRGGDDIDVERGPPRVRIVRDPEGAPDTFTRRLAGRAGTELNLDASHQRAHRDDVEVRQRALQIAD